MTLLIKVSTMDILGNFFFVRGIDNTLRWEGGTNHFFKCPCSFLFLFLGSILLNKMNSPQIVCT